MATWARAFLLLTLCALAFGEAGAQGRGKPFVRNYLPKDYSGHAQNWSILQDERGIMHIGNGNGVLSYDGTHFSITELPDKSTARSMAMGPDRIIYVGTSTEFGYLSIDNSGKHVFVNLAHHLPDSLRLSLTDIWETFSTSTHVYFRSYYVLIEYAIADGKIRYWETPQSNRFNTMFVLKDSIFIHVAGKGVYNPSSADTLALAPDGRRFITDRLPLGVTFPYKQDTIILSGRAGGLYKYPFSPNKEADDLFFAEANAALQQHRVYTSATRLRDGSYAIGSLGSGLLVFDRQFKLQQRIDMANNGLKNETIYCVATDRDGAVWLGGANGVGRVDLGADISFWDAGAGLLGTVYWAERHKGMLYVATSSSLYVIDSLGKVAQVEGVDNVQCWHLLSYTNPNDPTDMRLLVSSSREIREVIGLKTVVVADAGVAAAFKMQYDPFDPYRIWIAYGDGFGSIKFVGKKGDDPAKSWVTETRIAGAEDNNRSIQVESGGDIWIGTFRKGVIRLLKGEGERNYSAKRYTAKEHGLLSDKNVIIFRAAGQIIFGTDKGLCVYNPQTDRFDPFCELGIEYCNGSRDVFSMQEDKQENIWLSGLFVHLSPTIFAHKQAERGYTLDNKPFKKVPPMMALAMTVETDGTVWVGGAEGIFRYKSGESAENQDVAFHTLIRQVRIGIDSVLFNGNYFEEIGGKRIATLLQSDNSTHHFDAEHNTVAFHFTAPFFDNEDQTMYQFFLEGFDSHWSPWEKVSQKEYSNLPGGEYVFRVKARNLYGNESTEAVYRFSVSSPWYFRWYAWLAYFCIFVGTVVLAVRVNAKRLKAENERLEGIVNERTAEVRRKNADLQQQKEEIEAQAENLRGANTRILAQKDELTLKNVELSQQKEEILAQAENLRELNEEISSVNADLNEKQGELQKAYDNIQTLSHIGQEITSSLDLRQIIRMVYENVNRLMDASGFGVGVYVDATHKIEFNGYMEKGIALPDHADDTHNEQILSVKVFKSKQAFISNNLDIYMEEHGEKLDVTQGDVPLSVMYMPLLFRQKAVGVITVQSFNRNAYTETDQDILRTMASYASIAIVNAQSFDEIRVKNKSITDSIRYSHTMQKAFLPSKKELEVALGEHFIIYKPKDIVSGDFYWLAQPTESLTFVAVVDCTGHGVPGSFMSIIGSTILSEIVNMMRMYSPAAILEELHTQIVRVLSQNEKGNDDGMDLSLMCFERNGNAVNVTFCGAKNDLFYVKKGTDTLEILPGDRKSIGGRQRADKFFSDKTLAMEAGDCVYLFTDGMADQNDGSTRKFGSATLRRLLGQNAHKPMAQQEILLGREYHSFVGKAKQRDDITVLGFRL